MMRGPRFLRVHIVGTHDLDVREEASCYVGHTAAARAASIASTGSSTAESVDRVGCVMVKPARWNRRTNSRMKARLCVDGRCDGRHWSG